MLTVLTSGKAAPGTTTALWALALTWPRELLVVDADPAGGDLGAGLLSGRATGERGLVSWAVASRPGPASANGGTLGPGRDPAALLATHAVALPEQPGLRFLLGFSGAAQAAAFSTGTWQRLALALLEAADAGGDVLLDTGRLTAHHPGGPIVRAADRVLVVVRPSVRSVRAAQDACAWLRTELGDLRRASALVLQNGPYPAAEAADVLGLPLAGELPSDPAAAAALSDGARPRIRLDRSPLLRAARPLAARFAGVAVGGAA